MPKLVFYRDETVDGSQRTGLDLDDRELFEQFDPGEGETDPVLVWFVDVRCTGGSIPGDREGAIRWLLDATPRVARSLTDFAEHVRREGFPPSLDPRMWDEAADAGDDTRIRIACLIHCRIDADEIAEILEDVRDDYPAWIAGMIEKPEASPA